MTSPRQIEANRPRPGSVAPRRRRSSGRNRNHRLWVSEAILCRYEISYCACRHKVLSDIMSFRDSTPIFLSSLRPLYFCADDAEQAFLVRIEDPRPRISGRRNVTNRSPILGC